jgi:hypothetical protein
VQRAPLQRSRGSHASMATSDELTVHNDYAFATQEGAAKDAPSLWIGRLVRMTMRKPDRKAAVRRCPVGLASDLSGLELYCNWYRATARRGEYSLSNAVVDTAAYTWPRTRWSVCWASSSWTTTRTPTSS